MLDNISSEISKSLQEAIKVEQKKFNECPPREIEFLNALKSYNLMSEFKISEIPENIKKIMHKPTPFEHLNNLIYVKVLHYDFDENIKIGELVVNKLIAKDVLEIFKELYNIKYPIAKIKLIEHYDGKDELSMEDNNSYSYCYRKIEGSNVLSKHSQGLAIDINPILNPYIKIKEDGIKIIAPSCSAAYENRNKNIKGLITKGDSCYCAFIKRGFIWGGEWQTLKDYHHFEKP